MGLQCRHLDARIAALAGQADGIIGIDALYALGLSKSAIDKRARAGRLHRKHRGVFAVGHPAVSRRARRRAAVMACGQGALLSHRSAASHWGLLPSTSAVEVTIPRGRRGPAGIKTHRTTVLTAEDAAVHEGIPVTSPARTIVDMAGRVDRATLEKMIDTAERLRLFDLTGVEAALARLPRHRGAGRVREVLARYVEPPRTRSELERLFTRVAKRAGLRTPAVNATVAGLEVDALWAAEKLIVEADSWEFHRTRKFFETDRARDRELAVLGYIVLRVTWRALVRTPEVVADQIAALLERRAREKAA